jgi:hypothetical protein
MRAASTSTRRDPCRRFTEALVPQALETAGVAIGAGRLRMQRFDSRIDMQNPHQVSGQASRMVFMHPIGARNLRQTTSGSQNG